MNKQNNSLRTDHTVQNVTTNDFAQIDNDKLAFETS